MMVWHGKGFSRNSLAKSRRKKADPGLDTCRICGAYRYQHSGLLKREQADHEFKKQISNEAERRLLDHLAKSAPITEE